MRHLGLLCLNPILYLRAYVKSVAILRSVYRSSDRTIVLSPSYVTEFLKLAWVGDREHRLRAVTNPISPPAAFGDPGPGPLRKKKVLYVGRMDNATKRIDLLLHIWKRVQNRLSDWSLFLLGDGKDAPALRAMAERLQLKNVQFVGHVDPQEHLRDSAILCLTSSTEGSPIVLMEAQSWGVVPIAFSSFGAVFDIIQDGVNGLLAAPFDCAQYAEKLIMLARDEHRRSTLSRNAIDTSALYSAHVIADRYVELFAEQGFFTDQATRRPRPLPVDPGGV
jgi:glycosyltransferase involved in cell wall biosynthesis